MRLHEAENQLALTALLFAVRMFQSPEPCTGRAFLKIRDRQLSEAAAAERRAELAERSALDAAAIVAAFEKLTNNQPQQEVTHAAQD